MSNLTKYLRPRSRAADRSLFNRWMLRKVSTEEAIRLFKENNKIDEVVMINEQEFEIWMSSLGYKRSRI